MRGHRRRDHETPARATGWAAARAPASGPRVDVPAPSALPGAVVTGPGPPSPPAGVSCGRSFPSAARTRAAPMSVPSAAAPLRLIVLRHAESAWPADTADHDRPLDARGRSDARVVGQRLRALGWTPGVVLSSDARRARETW